MGWVTTFFGWFGNLTEVFKALTSKWALIFYAVLAVVFAGYWSYGKIKSAWEDYNFSMREEIVKELNIKDLEKAVRDQTATIEQMKALSESSSAALSGLADSVEATNDKYIVVERRIAEETKKAVAEKGNSEAPKELSPYMQRTLEIIDKADAQ